MSTVGKSCALCDVVIEHRDQRENSGYAADGRVLCGRCVRYLGIQERITSDGEDQPTGTMWRLRS